MRSLAAIVTPVAIAAGVALTITGLDAMTTKWIWTLVAISLALTGAIIISGPRETK